MARTAEQQAREMLARAGVVDTKRFTSGDLVEIANLIVRAQRMDAIEAGVARLVARLEQEEQAWEQWQRQQLEDIRSIQAGDAP